MTAQVNEITQQIGGISKPECGSDHVNLNYLNTDGLYLVEPIVFGLAFFWCALNARAVE